MLRADGPAEGDDSKETNIAVGLPTTDGMGDRGAKMSSEDNGANGRADDEADEDEELEEETEDESEEHVSEEIAEREEESERRKEKRPKTAKTTG